MAERGGIEQDTGAVGPVRSYYNENDPRAAAWLRDLIADGLIAAGDVDDRSICDVTASDVRGYTQCHFFAGVGGWSYALRLAGWSDDREVWTGSCPCPPFSVAGKKKTCPRCASRVLVPHPLRTGVFACCDCGHEWAADGRHLWPEFRRLIDECRPPVVFGEQVSGDDGLIWLAGVRATLEASGYAVGSLDTCAASVGAPHIRQRLYWVANTNQGRWPFRGGCGDRAHCSVEAGPSTTNEHSEVAHSGPTGGVGLSNRERLKRERLCLLERGSREAGAETAGTGEVGGVADSSRGGLGIDGCSSGSAGHANERGEVGGVADTEHAERGQEPGRGAEYYGDVPGRNEATGGPAARGENPWTNSLLLPCGDGKARRVGIVAADVADGIPDCLELGGETGMVGLPILTQAEEGRVMLLRGYGNAIVPPLAAEFIKAAAGAIDLG